MMEAVREWAASICAAAVLCAAAGMAAPEGKMKKSLQIVMSVVMLCAVIMPVKDIGSCSDMLRGAAYEPEESDERLLEVVEKQMSDSMSGAVQELVEDVVISSGAEYEEIIVRMDISDDGCITIGQVVIVLSQSNATAPDEVQKQVYEQLRIEAQIILPEEENDF